MIQGLRTAIYPVPDIAAAKAWYSRVLDQAPYFDQPYYVGFAVGGFELGLVPDGTPSPDGAQVYWGVPDAEAAMAHLETLGATEHTPVTDVGDRIKVAAVNDPFGNVFRIIENPHFDLAAVR
ncbi:glyoxalase/bleomycin resistance/extradiol dioxygenase family protein [bacterium]|nr:VOC family protein [Chloroflexi bacterium CFX6]RIL08538.1 MAG: glyoxalase/bleomycin resistance/extradiol dioxygenase family protein [bacterium]